MKKVIIFFYVCIYHFQGFGQKLVFNIQETSMSISRYDRKFNKVHVQYKISNCSSSDILFSDTWIDKKVIHGSQNRLLPDSEKINYINADPFIPPEPFDSLIQVKREKIVRVLKLLQRCNNFEITEELLSYFIFTRESTLLKPKETVVFQDDFLISKKRKSIKVMYQLKVDHILDLSDILNEPKLVIRNCTE